MYMYTCTHMLPGTEVDDGWPLRDYASTLFSRHGERVDCMSNPGNLQHKLELHIPETFCDCRGSVVITA